MLLSESLSFYVPISIKSIVQSNQLNSPRSEITAKLYHSTLTLTRLAAPIASQYDALTNNHECLNLISAWLSPGSYTDRLRQIRTEAIS